jgi:hypothetical protein
MAHPVLWSEGEREREREKEREKKEQKVQACSKRSSFSQSVSMRDYYINVGSLIYNLAILPACFVGQMVLNEDSTVCLDGARPANTCIPPYFLGKAPI